VLLDGAYSIQGYCLNILCAELQNSTLKKIEPGQNRLILYPETDAVRQEYTGMLAAELLDSNFVSEILENDMSPGTDFMKLLTFVGCSPVVAANEDPVSYNKYSIRIVSSVDPVIITSNRLRSPLCPVCGTAHENSTAADSIERAGDHFNWVCQACSAAIPVDEINWRNKLAIASSYIQINGVFEGESIPADKLLDRLAVRTGVPWSYCYC